jgi:aromatic ring-opening dioxygenase catalytic subunit (LigB family)
MANLLPAIFFCHGNPMNALTSNGYTEAWRRTTRKFLENFMQAYASWIDANSQS